MKSTVILLALGLLACGGGGPGIPADAPPMCVMKGYPPRDVKFALVKQLQLGKQTYGGARPLTIRLVAEAHRVHADAIFNYSGGQRFGFWPWRFIRPVVSGDAVRIDNPEAFDCRALGGELYPGALQAESEYERGRREERERLQ